MGNRCSRNLHSLICPLLVFFFVEKSSLGLTTPLFPSARLRSRHKSLGTFGTSRFLSYREGRPDLKEDSLLMPRGVKKENLPAKICVTCGRPFTWRKKRERVWDEVTTCSKSCNRKRKESQRATSGLKRGATIGVEPSEFEDQASSILDSGGAKAAIGIFTDTRIEEDLASDTEKGTIMEGDDAGTLFYEMDATVSGNSDIVERNGDSSDDAVARRKAERKAAKKAKKAARRAQREGRGDPSAGQKPCDMCGKSVDLLIRCTYDESGAWKMVCGKCWNVASGGVVDGDANHPYYRYGGLWKNRRSQR